MILELDFLQEVQILYERSVRLNRLQHSYTNRMDTFICNYITRHPHLLEIDWTAQERVDTMLPHMMEAAGVTEELKVCDPMRWVGLMNTLKVQVEETIFQELIFQ